jgi:hypothetical protein
MFSIFRSLNFTSQVQTILLLFMLFEKLNNDLQVQASDTTMLDRSPKGGYQNSVLNCLKGMELPSLFERYFLQVPVL